MRTCATKKAKPEGSAEMLELKPRAFQIFVSLGVKSRKGKGSDGNKSVLNRYRVTVKVIREFVREHIARLHIHIVADRIKSRIEIG